MGKGLTKCFVPKKHYIFLRDLKLHFKIIELVSKEVTALGAVDRNLKLLSTQNSMHATMK